MAPSLIATLLPHQEIGATWCLEREESGCILADDMGLGKTVTACAVMVRRVLPTLIIAPLTLVHQWNAEISKHTHGISAWIHHGAQRHKHVARFPEHDVVITNPETVVSDWKRGVRSIYGGFKRVVIDEAHMLRNGKSKIHEAVMALFSNGDAPPCKIFLTGTPVCNKTDDLINMVTLLNMDPYNDRAFWKRTDIAEKLTHLQEVRNLCILRRTKTDILANELPNKEVKTVTLELDSSETYTKEYTRLRAWNIKPVIAKILRLRQCVNQISLIHNMLEKDQKVMEEYSNSLPSEVSAKLEYISRTISETPPDDKVVVFSQWTSMLAHIKSHLGNGVECEVYHGKLTTDEKEAALERFRTDPSVKVLLMSLRAGSCGLNLCVANHVIITEPYFNAAEENQAIDRVYRIGQTKNVFVHKLVVPSTVENWMLQLQKYKGTISDSILNKDANEETVEEVITQQDMNKEMFRKFVKE